MTKSLPLAALLLASCHASSDPGSSRGGEGRAATNRVDSGTSAPGNSMREPTTRKAASVEPHAIAAPRTLAEWRKSANRSTCAPIAFTDVGGADATPRAAAFAGGWAVAFDQPGARSLYGVAGTGVAVNDVQKEIAKVGAQWPYGRAPGHLVPGAFAGYGIEGAGGYPASNPDGRGQKSLAYLVIPGQRCLYNVWSSLGRRHLETLLDGLVLLPTR